MNCKSESSVTSNLALCDVITADKQQLGQNKIIRKDMLIVYIKKNVSSSYYKNSGKVLFTL